jgi:carboxypeptidase Taq
MNPQAAYDELVVCSRQRMMLTSCLELLGWDELTHMPHGGVENRGRQMAYLSGLYHATATDPRIGELLQTVAESPLVADPLSPPAVNVRQWRWSYDRLCRLPRALVEELASLTTEAQQVWAVARQDNDFRAFCPWLQRIVGLKRAEAECLGHDGVPYDALLQEYEPEATTASVAARFLALRADVTRLLDSLESIPRLSRPALLRREFPIDRQRVFIEAVASDVGFDFDRGRLDSTTHPFFSLIGPGDCRITTRYNQYDFSEAFFSTLHEMGHGLYEQGLDAEHHGTPFGESMLMSIHESQSRLWEQLIGRGLPFWRHFFPRAKEIFHQALHDVSLQDFVRAVNHVQRGVNRVQADAVTYDLHVMVRFDLERALIAGDLSASDLPAAWNSAMADYVGVTPATDSEGCLQDGHWSAGQFGYFPAYTLGNMAAAQLFAQLRQDLPLLDEQLAVGNFADLRAWLHDRVYCHGQRYSTSDLIERITGNRPDHRPLVEVLRQQQSALHRM